ncbi:hypothetical protein KM917_19515 [Virgibacillus pantothenticus]|uniref:hypothetical protein n=1 Tax=Virgibacillus pantothenticus TaxID=1473 RepID=UPI0012EC80C5|nr:hypothetical protein [Virgibacillus pantothenticus]MBS7427827.1 hypothetical protein [Virgibacillus sp. 19R1-5]MBU8670649.1 hypothetical protein [Virgibacillus pantothenticus]
MTTTVSSAIIAYNRGNTVNFKPVNGLFYHYKIIFLSIHRNLYTLKKKGKRGDIFNPNQAKPLISTYPACKVLMSKVGDNIKQVKVGVNST